MIRKFILLAVGLLSSVTAPVWGQKISGSISVDTLYSGDLGIRALVKSGDTLWFGGKKGSYGFHILKTGKTHKAILKPDTLDFRSIAQTKNRIFLLNAGSPAYLYALDKSSLDKKVVYTENHPKAFYDSMKFINPKEGWAMGDPVGKCFSVLKTTDGGNTWEKIPCENMPNLYDGEASFAASNSNLVLHKQNIWIVSGGSKARVFHSQDKGKNWKVYTTPIQQGESTTGIYTADFATDKIGMIAGGNYLKPNSNSNNKALTLDGGETWKILDPNSGFGYASCIKAIPGTQGKEWICASATGVYYTLDQGSSWKLIYKNYDLYTLEVISKKEIYASGKSVLVRIQLE